MGDTIEPGDESLETEPKELVLDVFRTLPDAEQKALRLRLFENWKLSQIAQ